MDNRNRDKMSRESSSPTSAGNVNRDVESRRGMESNDSSASFGQNIGRSENLNEPSRRTEKSSESGWNSSSGRQSGSSSSGVGSSSSNRQSGSSPSGSKESSSSDRWGDESSSDSDRSSGRH